jgi:hypothetical protein
MPGRCPREGRRRREQPARPLRLGRTVTLVTHAAAAKAGLERKMQVAAAVAGLGGRCTTVDSYYMVPVVDGDDAVRAVKALGVDHIATLAAADVTDPADGGLCGKAGATGQGCGDADRHGQPGMDARARGEQSAGKRQPAADAVRAEPTLHPDGERQDNGVPAAVRKRPGGQSRGSMWAMVTMMLLMLVGLPECVAFRTFDCNSQSSQVEQYSLLDPEPCGNMEKVHAIEREL